MPTPRPPTREELAEEMGRTTPDSELGFLRLARRKLLLGQAVRPKEFATTYNCSPTVLNGAVSTLRQAGYVIAADTEDNPDWEGSGPRTRRVFRVLKAPELDDVPPAEPVTPPADDAPMETPRTTKARKSRKKATKATKATRKRQASPPATVEATPPPVVSANGHVRIESEGMEVPGIGRLPSLLQSVSVFALAVDDDENTITIGLRDANTKWLLTLTGQHER